MSNVAIATFDNRMLEFEHSRRKEMINNKFGDKVTARQYAKQCVWMYGANASYKWHGDNNYYPLMTQREVDTVDAEIDLQTRRVKKFLFGDQQ